MMAWRKAGKLGEGGGPGKAGRLFLALHPMGLGQAQVLQVGAGD